MNVCVGCGAPIRWVLTVAGKRLPIDPEPTEDGNVVVRDVDGQPRAHVLTGPELPAREQAWRPHWATCPKAGEFRAPPATGRRPLCTVCQLPLDPVLAAREPYTTHPSCDPEAVRARAAYKAAADRAGAEAARAAARERTAPP